MLEAKLDQASVLKKIVEAIREIITDCNFECSESGIALHALDSSHICLICMLLGSDGFSEYRCDRNITLGVNVNSLSTVLKIAGNDDVLTLRAEDKPNDLQLTFEDTKQDRLSNFNLKLMDIDQAYLSIPETEYTASITMPSAELQRICRDFNAVSDSVTVEATKDGVLFSADGDLGSGSVHLKPYSDIENKDKSVNINVSEPATLKFNLKYFNNITRAASLSSTVQIQMCNDLPAEIEFKLPNGYVRYYFAPKYE